ncbi:MAG: hypothetical protein WC390_10900 [Sulfurimonas sp.]|jgi:hypothetical protein
MKYLISLIIAITIQADTIDVKESNGVYTTNKMTIYNLYAKNDGYAQIDKTPHACGTVHLLDSKGKNIGSLIKGYETMNKKVEQGKLKLMVTPDEQCKISFSIPD